jgi:transglutaminase-like putative cysteine protease
MFGGYPRGWQRVQAICDLVHAHVTFGYGYARSTRTALEVFNERVGVCRDFQHLAVTMCRCLNIPARYAEQNHRDHGKHDRIKCVDSE